MMKTKKYFINLIILMEKGRNMIIIYTLRFEGVYKNGKRNGKGKEYYNNDNLKFEGKFLDSKKWEEKDMIYLIKLYMN